MACLKHGKELAKILTDKGSCPWCYIEQVEVELSQAKDEAAEWEESANNNWDEIDALKEELAIARDEYRDMESELKAEINGLERELTRAEQEIMDGS